MMMTPEEAEQAALEFLVKEQRGVVSHVGGRFLGTLLLCDYCLDGVLAVDQPMVEVDRLTGACRYSELTVINIIGTAR